MVPGSTFLPATRASLLWCACIHSGMSKKAQMVVEVTAQIQQGTDELSVLIHDYHSQGLEVQQIFSFQSAGGAPKLFALLQQHRD